MSDVVDEKLAGQEKLFEFLRWNSYRSERRKLLYVATPKVACTSLKWWFAALEGYAQALHDINDSSESDPDLVVHESHKVAPHVTGLVKEQLIGALTSDEYFRFALVRNPYKRIFSAWQSKLVLQEPLQVGRYLSFDFFHLPMKSRQDIAPAFEAFLEHLAANEAPSFWDHHWVPQVSILRPDVIDYSQIAKIEDSAQFSKTLQGWLGDHTPDPFAVHRANESLIPFQPEFLTARSAELLRVMYANDFEAFGYDTRVPDAKESFSEAEATVALKAVHLLRARHTQLGQRLGHIARLQAESQDRGAKVDWLHQAVAERDARIGELNSAVGEEAGQVEALQRSIAERDAQIGDLHGTVAARDAQLGAVQDAAGEHRQQIDLLQDVVAQHVAHLAQLAGTIAEREKVNRNLSRAVTERDVQVSSLNRQVIERSAQVVSLNKTVAAAESRIASLTHDVAQGVARLAEREAHGAHLEHVLREREGHVAALTDQLDASNALVAAERGRLQEVFASRTWRLAVGIRKGATAYRHALGALPVARFRRTLQTKAAARTLRNSQLFDSAYYVEQNPDVRTAGIDPVLHYLAHGWREQRNPSPLFNTAQYLADSPDVAQVGMEPLTHYLRFGQAEGRNVCRLLPAEGEADTRTPSVEQEVAQLEAVQLAAEPVAHDPHSDRINDEVAVIEQSGLFDTSYYASVNPDLAGLSPQALIRHYCEHGWREGRKPADDFDTRYYLQTYKDIQAAGINPFWHYAIAGAKECRHAAPPLKDVHEDEILFGKIEPDVKLVAFYKSFDWSAVRAGRPLFKGHVQPVTPSDVLGFYDPQDRDVMLRQMRIARAHGIHAFCFDLRASEDGIAQAEPVDGFLATDCADIRFCVNIEADMPDRASVLAKRLAHVVADRRYMRFGAKPVVLVSIHCESQDAAAFLARLRLGLAEQGVPVPYFIGRWTSARDEAAHAALDEIVDAALDLPAASEVGQFVGRKFNDVNVVPYSVVAGAGIARIAQSTGEVHARYPVVTLARDNTATAPANAVVYTRFDVKDYRRWLDAAIEGTRTSHSDGQRAVFLDAWNDWNEGVALEPDSRTGFSSLNETSRALTGIAPGQAMPKVSVIVPNYNHAPFLRRRLDSIYGQTYKNIEVLLLDDCSPDESRAVLDEYAAAYPEVTRTLYNTTNSGGVFRQWAKGIQAASGKLVWVAESDDYCDEHFLERLVRCFDDEAVLLAYGYSQFVDRDEDPIEGDFHLYLSDLEGADKWKGNYLETAHNEVKTALGIKNTIPNASSVLFRRPVDLPLLQDESWLSMRVAGDWVFYLHVLRGGKIAYRSDAINFFRRYPGSTADTTYKKEIFYREVGLASRTAAELYDVPLEVLERCRKGYEDFYWKMVGRDYEEFLRWYDYLSVLQARQRRVPNIIVSTMGFSPGGAEILPIRIANELKRQGHSVLLLNTGLMSFFDRIRGMVRNDVPVVETADLGETREVIRQFGIEALNSHHWHIQKYPFQVPDVFDELRVHVASLHGMIEHDAFGVTDEQLLQADEKVTNWVFTANKNVVPFADAGLYDEASTRFVKIANGMMAPTITPVSRAQMQIPDDAFVLCCVSRAIEDKGWAEAIEAVARARKLSSRDIRLVLVGNGPVYDEYCQTGVDDFVYLAGFSENSVGHYASADVGIMLTKFKSESFPLTIVDCLFAGKPYIASDVGDIRNMLTQGQDVAGAVVELEDWEVPVDTVAQIIAAFASEKQKYLDACALVGDVAKRYKIDVVTSKYVDLFNAARHDERFGAHRRHRKLVVEGS
ncbi:glycoside hydrolase family 99-like domain-containing protein [Paraburkholderia bannensis]|uniref:glycoside hydrolase family 99-like domain-containing protein n=1 Tax=Paraburkholderia bannensis TaxID=765414 RepID=UPI0006932CCE|nr:glycoside hydrolase family 99-like domain-containing protein [Paraburkholderia bannensis]